MIEALLFRLRANIGRAGGASFRKVYDFGRSVLGYLEGGAFGVCVTATMLCQGMTLVMPQVPQNQLGFTGCEKNQNVVILSEAKDLGV